MKVRILYLEDSSEDVELVTSLLEASGYDCEVTVIDSEAGLRENLENEQFDLILSDCALPGYDGVAALSTVKRLRPELPFVFVSGVIGEEMAIECVKAGATDYVLKNRLSRLPPVVDRAVKEARAHQDHEEIKRELEATRHAFYQSQKMETIGRLTGGIAHDFNNMLAVILGYAEVVQRVSASDDPRQQYLGEIVTASRRAAGLVEQLLSYSRNQRLSPENLQLNDELETVAKMLRRLVGERISVEISLDEGLWPVEIDRVRFDQVIFNLVTNARDAIGESGSITITTENHHVGLDTRLIAPELSPGDYVLVRVSDTGSGMDEKLLDSIFEPFFTTKDPGKGTGLGLASSLGIIRQSGGAITVSSQPDRGTEFAIYLPRATKRSTPYPAEGRPSLQEEVAAGTTILVVDDDLSVLNLMKLVLNNAGYRVLSANSGRSAIDRADAHHAEIDLLLTDVILPDCSGVELRAALHPSCPSMKVGYTSGYGNSVIEELGLSNSSTGILPKPFTVDDLLDRVKDWLGPAPLDPG